MSTGERHIRVKLGERSYPIWVGEDCPLEHLHELIRLRKVLVVADSHTAPLFAERVVSALKQAPSEVSLSVFEAGERSKNLASVEAICRDAVKAGLDRGSVFVALGGGVCGDMTGLAAALYMRGTRFIQLPTTLLAMVDSSVGGKTGVDLPEGKNLVGAFFQPQAVLIDPENLRSLPPRQLSNGFAEIVKTAMILDGALFDRLENAAADLFALSSGAPVSEVIARCCELKAQVVSRDEKESGLRAILNYGHTFGHALESVTGYQKFEHGEAVAVGMCMAADLAQAEGMLTQEEALRQEKLLKAFHLPVTAAGLGLSPDRLLRAMQHDKKTSGGKIRVVLPVRIGHAEVFSNISQDRLTEALCARI
ncbi:MAG: 3-dehydroquinate synthase [Lentisphaeria bacterium]|nr:3-dehydroquinate synthase [Lentisphaeria bacterium]